MTQSRAMSAVETAANIGIGLVISFISQLTIFHFYGVEITMAQNIQMTLWFTVISIIRSYCLRRFFNSLRSKS